MMVTKIIGDQRITKAAPMANTVTVIFISDFVTEQSSAIFKKSNDGFTEGSEAH